MDAGLGCSASPLRAQVRAAAPPGFVSPFETASRRVRLGSVRLCEPMRTKAQPITLLGLGSGFGFGLFVSSCWLCPDRLCC